MLVTVSARKSELKSAKITLIAIVPTNSPTLPGIRAIGAKANVVVRVDPNSGTARWRTVRVIAAEGVIPWCRRSCTSSTMTMALSIKSPKAMIRPVTDI